jgi:hypothetical protein
VADAVRQVYEQAPAIIDQLSADEKAFALEVSSMVAAGTDAETAVTMVREGLRRPKAERDLMTQAYRDEAKRNRGELADLVDDTFDTLFTWEPEVPMALEAEFGSLTESYYMRTGSADSARQLAWEDLTRVWGVTEIHGKRQLMKYPPEFAGGTRASFERETADIEGTIEIVADSRTARDGGKSYALVTIQDNGMPSAVTNDKGAEARWYPERTIDPEVARESQSRLTRSKKTRAIRQLYEGAGDVSLEDIRAMEDKLRGD